MVIDKTEAATQFWKPQPYMNLKFDCTNDCYGTQIWLVLWPKSNDQVDLTSGVDARVSLCFAVDHMFSSKQRSEAALVDNHPHLNKQQLQSHD